MHDGEKDKTVSRIQHRELLKESLDEVMTEKISTDYLKDSVECKLFGIGSESYVVGSHEFYMGYAVKNNMLLTLDAGHFHPTEGIADKISSMLLFVPEVNLHVSRPERWDSDHVVILNDALLELSQDRTLRTDGEGTYRIGLFRCIHQSHRCLRSWNPFNPESHAAGTLGRPKSCVNMKRETTTSNVWPIWKS